MAVCGVISGLKPHHRNGKLYLAFYSKPLCRILLTCAANKMWSLLLLLVSKLYSKVGMLCIVHKQCNTLALRFSCKWSTNITKGVWILDARLSPTTTTYRIRIEFEYGENLNSKRANEGIPLARFVSKVKGFGWLFQEMFYSEEALPDRKILLTYLKSATLN